MSDATTPADPTGQIATTPAVLSPETPIVPTSGTKRVPDDSEAAVVRDAQQYDWRRDALTLVCFTTDDESHQALKRFIDHIERLEAERDAAVDFREDFDCRQLKAERDVLLAEHEAMGAMIDDFCVRHVDCSEECDGWEGCSIRLWAAAHDNAEKVIRG